MYLPNIPLIAAIVTTLIYPGIIYNNIASVMRKGTFGHLQKV